MPAAPGAIHVDACAGCGRSFDAEPVEGHLVSPHVTCPHCGRERTVGAIAAFDIHAGNRHFYGEQSRSLAQGCHPSEVRFLKKLVGPSLESCVLSTGDVRFKNRQQERAFVAAMEKARTTNAAVPGCYLTDRGQAKMRARQAAATPAFAPGKLRVGSRPPS